VNPIVHRVYVGSYQRLVGRLFAVCGDLAGAEDLVQEAFARAVQHHHRFAQTDNPRRGCALSQSISPAVAGGGTWWVTGSTACQSDPDRSVAGRSPAPGHRHSKGVSACVTSTICSTATSPAPHAARRTPQRHPARLRVSTNSGPSSTARRVGCDQRCLRQRSGGCRHGVEPGHLHHRHRSTRRGGPPQRTDPACYRPRRAAGGADHRRSGSVTSTSSRLRGPPVGAPGRPLPEPSPSSPRRGDSAGRCGFVSHSGRLRHSQAGCRPQPASPRPSSTDASYTCSIVSADA